LNINTYAQQLIKEFTPLLGYISWTNFQWIIIINCSKIAQKHVLQCSNCQTNCSNGFPASQNPYLGSFDTSIGRKMKKLGLLEVSLFKLVVSGSAIHTPLE
jgi:hypothetical protein